MLWNAVTEPQPVRNVYRRRIGRLLRLVDVEMMMDGGVGKAGLCEGWDGDARNRGAYSPAFPFHSTYNDGQLMRMQRVQA
jgi:hypothetical protein